MTPLHARFAHVFDRVHCVWRWVWLAPAQWAALPHVVVVLGLTCGATGPSAARDHVEPVVAPAAPRVYPAPPRPRVDLAPVFAPDARLDQDDFRGVIPVRYEIEHNKPGHDDIPEPGTLALMAVELVGLWLVLGAALNRRPNP